MTILQIQKSVTPYVAISRAKLYRVICDCHIKPLGMRQRPQNYPPDAVSRILTHLGFVLGNGDKVIAGPYNGMKGYRHAKNGATRGIPSMAALRASRKKARAGK